MISVVSLFCGAGGMDLGFEKAGYNIVWANDIDKYAIQTYKTNFKNVKVIEGDISSIKEKDIPIVDVIIGGFPCQDFSVLGGSNRKGIYARRGRLYRDFVRIVKHIKPKIFVAENVKGILSANRGLAIKIIKRDFEYLFDIDISKEFFEVDDINNLEKSYYVFVDLYRFVEYGVPQTRERVLIIGIRKDVYENSLFEYKKVEGFLCKEDMYVTSGEVLEGKLIYDIPVKMVKYNNEVQKLKPKTVQMLSYIPEGGNYSALPEQLKVKGLMSNIYRRLDRNKPSPTIIANGGGGTWGYHYEENRSLTNRERARLQTFPDEFIFLGPIGEVRKQIGNAVPPLGILPIGLFLKKFLIKEYNENLDKYYLEWEKLKNDILKYKSNFNSYP